MIGRSYNILFVIKSVSLGSIVDDSDDNSYESASELVVSSLEAEKSCVMDSDALLTCVQEKNILILWSWKKA